MGSVSRYYLTLYNALQCAGWVWVLQRLLGALVAGAPVYVAVETPLQIFQTLALLEVVHAAAGLVRASAATTALQLASRVWITWGVLELAPAAQATPALATMVAAWAFTEVPRYLYFAVVARGGKPPYGLVWLRYTTFFPLYPLGAGSEFLIAVAALPTIRATGALSCALPNAWNFALNYWALCVVALAFYFPGLPFMYSHMIAQRRKYLGKARAAATTKAA